MRVRGAFLIVFGLGACAPPALLPLSVDEELARVALDDLEQQETRIPRRDEPAAYAELDRLFEAVTTHERVSHDALAWKVHLFDEDAPRGRSAGGGVVVVNRGLIDVALSEDELVATLAHEVGHGDLRHGVRSLEGELWTALVMAVGLGGTWTLQPVPQRLRTVGLLGLGEWAGTLLGAHTYRRAFEHRADAFAVDVLCHSPWDPRALAEVTIREGSTWRTLGRTHPMPNVRARRIEARADALGCGHGDGDDSGLVRLREALAGGTDAHR